MAFWFVLAVMTAAAMCAVVWPLVRRSTTVATGNDVAVYRDQLEEIDRDRSHGSIDPAEAEAARVEVSRRLLAAAEAAHAAKGSGADGRAAWYRLAAFSGALVVPLAAIWLYLVLGSPELPGQPLAERLAAVHAGRSVTARGDNAPLAGLVARVEAHLRDNPDDGRGWEVLGPAYMRLMRFDDAVQANRNIIRLLGSTPDRQANLGESMIAAADGVVTEEAKSLLTGVLQADPDNVTAGFYLGLAAKQAGRIDEARGIWQGMLARAPEGAAWAPFVSRALGVLDGQSAAPAAAPEVLEPPEELPADQREMARGMVERLADRLRENGGDVEGWLRLVRSYMVMAERDTAREVVRTARTALAGEPEKLKRLESGVKQLGLQGVTTVADVAAAMRGSAAAPQQGQSAAPTEAAPAGGQAAAPPPADPPSANREPAAPPAADSGAVRTAAQAGALDLPPEQRDAMQGLIDRLALRLRDNGADVDGWLRLLRSYVALGERDKAREAATDARRALSGDADKLHRLDDAMKELGLEG